MVRTLEQFKKDSAKLYRQLLKENYQEMKRIVEGLRYVESPEMLERYKDLAWECLWFKKVVKRFK